MTSSNSNLLMLGLRGSGKTTYLAALWHYLEAAEVESRLSLPLLQADRAYLNGIRSNWLAMNPVGRTSMRVTSTVSLSLIDKKHDSKVDIRIPDLSGESFRLQWATRKAPFTYASFAKDCTGALMFVHPEGIKTTRAIKAEVNEELPSAEDPPSEKLQPSKNWSAEMSSTQVQLVDMLQLLIWLRESKLPIRIGLVISAWDLIKARISPAEWLEVRLPLLSQFLRSNSDRFAAEIFGVSAQGGDLIEDRSRLLASEVPSTRCRALKGSSLDPLSISAPLQFLLNTE